MRANFNTLPPRPEYIKKVITVLHHSGELRAIDIERKTGLTKTQTGCTLDKLLLDGKVSEIRDKKVKRYSLIKD